MGAGSWAWAAWQRLSHCRSGRQRPARAPWASPLVSEWRRLFAGWSTLVGLLSRLPGISHARRSSSCTTSERGRCLLYGIGGEDFGTGSGIPRGGPDGEDETWLRDERARSEERRAGKENSHP